MKKLFPFIISILFPIMSFGQPSNDNPSGAISLDVGVSFETYPVIGDNTGATDSENGDPTIPDPGCAFYSGQDVWFSVVVPENGTLTIETAEGGPTPFNDTGLAVYSGNIGAFSLEACNDDFAGFFSRIVLNDLTPGSTLYIRVWQYGGGPGGSFLISAFSPSPPAEGIQCFPATLFLDNFGSAFLNPNSLIQQATEETFISVSGNDGTGGGLTDFTVTIISDVEISFDWDYTTTDSSPLWDTFGFLLEGVYNQLTINGGNNQQGGSETISLTAGQIFGFRSYTLDGFGGSAITTISNFSPGFEGQFAIENWTSNNTSDGTTTQQMVPLEEISTITASQSVFSCADIGQNEITVTVEFVGGGIMECNSFVSILDPLGYCTAQDIVFDPISAVEYGSIDFDLTATGGSSGNPVIFSSSDETVATISGTTVSVSNAGITTITASQAGNATYAPATPVEQILEVTPLPITVTADAFQSKKYLEVDPILTYQTNMSLINGDSFAGFLERAPGEDTGEYAITLGTLNNANYAISFISAGFTIQSVAIVINADDISKVYGENDPTLTFTTVPVLTNNDIPNGMLTRAPGETVGSYSISANSLEPNNGNYWISASSNGNFSITPKELTITGLEVNDKDYDGTVDATLSGTPLLNGVLASDDGLVSLESSSAFATFADPNAGLDIPIMINGYSLTGSAASNYSLVQPGSFTASIFAAPQTLTFPTIPDQVFGGGQFALGASVNSGLPISYSAMPAGRLTVDASGTATIVGQGTVTVIASQAGNNNYEAAISSEQTFCINPPKPIISASFANPEAPVLTSDNEIGGDQWFLSDNAISGETGKTLVPSAQGMYTVQTTFDNCVSEMSNGFSVLITAIDDKSKIKIWPNPVSDYLNISVNEKNILYRVFSIEGVEMNFPGNFNSNGLRIDVREASSGMYLLYMISEDTVQLLRFVKN